NEDEKKFNFEQTQIFQNLLKKYRQQFTTIPTEAIATVLMRVHKSIPTPEQQQLLLTRLKSLSMGEALSFAQNLKPEDIAMLLSYDMAFSTQASTPEADKNPLQQVITTIAGYLHRDKGLWYVNYRSAQAGEHGKGFHGTIGKSGMGECCSSASANGAAAAAGAAARGSLGGASGGSGGGGGGSNGGFGGGITTHAAMTRAEAFSGEKQKSSSSSIQTKSAARTAERASQKNSSEGHVIPFPAVWENRRESVAIRTAPITSIKRETAVPLQASKTRPIAKAALGVIRPTRQEIPQPARVARTPDRSTSPAKHLRTEPRPQVRKITKHPESPRVIQRKQRAPESIHTLRTERISSPARHRTGRETISGKVKTKEQFLAPISALPAPERRATPPPARHIEIGSKLRTALQHFDRAVNTGSTQTQHNTAISERSSQLAQALQKASRTQQEVTASDTHTATTTQEQTVTAATNQQTKQENQAQTAPASEATQQTETASGSTQEQSKSAERTDSQHATTETTQTTVETPSEAIKETSEARSENTKTQSEEFAPATVAAEKKQAEVQTPGAEKTTTTQMAERQTEASSQVAQSKSETVSQTTEAVTNHDQQQVEAAATSENHELAGEADITQVAKDTAMTTTIHAESAPAQEDESGIVESNQSPEVSEIGTHEVRQLQQKAAAKKATGEATDHFVTAQVSSHANAEAGVMLDPSVLDMSNPYGMTSDIRFFLNSLARQLA
ncbi:MAG TPA: hypothetical protein VG935_04335, partial [Patescibacteria group bacterium]|nr:hypothetical protein [Patescibacteria group bacterium]